MLPCFSSENLRNLEKSFEDGSQQFADTLIDLSQTITKEVESTLNELSQIFFPSEYFYNSEHYGVIAKVEPLAPEVPEEYHNQCYHRITLTDGSSFQLIFDHLEFRRLEDRLVPGYYVKIVYRMPNYKIINIYPRPYCYEMDYDEFLDSVDVQNDQQVRATYLEGKLKKVEFIDEEEENQKNESKEENLKEEDEQEEDDEIIESKD